MKLAGVCLPVVLWASAVSSAVADDGTSPFTSPSYLGVMAGYTFAEEDRGVDVDYGTGLELFYGSRFGEGRWGFELGLSLDNFETGSEVGVDYYRNSGGFDLTYSFGQRDAFTPFLIAGVGAGYNDVLPDSEDDWSLLANAGIGFVTGPLTRRGQIRFRAEVRYVYDDFADGYGEPRINLGLEIPLLELRGVTPPAEEQVKIVEVEVPTGLLDSDGDGVVDDRDECPGTPAGTRVDGVGCPLPKIIDLRGVTFEFNKTRLRPDAVTILDWATGILKKYPDMQVEVAGHTDSIGSDTYNQTLSEGRAQAVREYFIQHGVPASQMSARGYGESEPIDSNETEDGREHNRRVELRVLN